MANGIAVNVLNKGINLERLFPMIQAPGNPMASETSTLKNACFIVNLVTDHNAAFSKTVIVSRLLKAPRKAAP